MHLMPSSIDRRARPVNTSHCRVRRAFARPVFSGTGPSIIHCPPKPTACRSYTIQLAVYLSAHFEKICRGEIF